MNDHSRSVDIKHHGIKQGYLQDNMKIGGVSSLENTSDILTKNLNLPLHAKHCSKLHILTPVVTNHTNLLTNNAVSVTKKNERTNPHHVHPHTKATTQTPSDLCHQPTRAQNPTAQQKGNAKRRDNNTGTASSLKEKCADNWEPNTTSSHNAHSPPSTQGIYNITNKDLNLHGNHIQKHRSHLPTRKKTTTMKLQKLPRATLGNSVECPKSPQQSFN
jgi:hypothetical protein